MSNTAKTTKITINSSVEMRKSNFSSYRTKPHFSYLDNKKYATTIANITIKKKR